MAGQEPWEGIKVDGFGKPHDVQIVRQHAEGYDGFLVCDCLVRVCWWGKDACGYSDG